MKRQTIIVIIAPDEVEVLGKFADFDEACDFCDKQNDEIIDPVH